MTVPTLHNSNNLGTSLLNAQLPHSSDVKTIGIQTMQVGVDTSQHITLWHSSSIHLKENKQNSDVHQLP